ncbi:M24 family metallopeptidase [Kallotenue papyrolyticum]|uniref:M24 family metallopeptidase n=1 Tax=Kallotenue papyrolyticum TaxID=1325125 RepID=UPI00049279FA|nr:Xaa-Pro peptidase family protein [Kallotenue papyrolyticum]
MTTHRIERLRAALARAGLDALALVPGANLWYLLGLTIHPSERLAIAFIPAAGPIRVVLPALEQPRAAAEARVPVRWYPWRDDTGYEAVLRACAGDLQLGGRLGVEYTAMRLLELRAIEAVARVETIDATGLLAELRMVKDTDELAAMRAAVRAVEAGLAAAIAAIRPGVTEREIAAAWEQAMRAAGSAEPAFTTIVASGPNSANPHHTTGERQIQTGDLVILDGGARVGGYVSDITRTVAVGEIDAELRRVYEIVREANAAGVAAARPSVSGAQIDAAARSVIEQAGYGAYFIHRTGHGLGLETHEPPYLHAANRAPLPSGATFTVEPGIYLPGRGGVRIEDDVVLTDHGAERLTTFPRELIVC